MELRLDIPEREKFIKMKGKHHKKEFICNTDSVAGSVSQRACVYSGARVVLNPIEDAVHLVHGPIGCASYTWDIRGSLSSGSELFRNSFSSDLKESDVIFGGEEKLSKCIDEIYEKYKPKLIFVYSTCIAGVIGDDIKAVCKESSKKYNIYVVPVESSGFVGNKAAGYKAACNSLLDLIKEFPVLKKEPLSINYMGDFNLAGEAWIIKGYLNQMGLKVNTIFTGDSNFESLKKATASSLNIVQCAGSMTYLAKKFEETFDIPYMKVSFLGIEDTSNSLRKIAAFFNDKDVMLKTEKLIEEKTKMAKPIIEKYKRYLKGKKAAIFVGGGFKAISLIKQFRELGIDVVVIGTQNGQKDEYEKIEEIADYGTVILDDANPSELEKFMVEKGADILAGGVKERFLSYKMGIAFIDHNHDRKHPLSGYEGAINFAEEVYTTACSPVWKYVKDGVNKCV
ncbi:MULTISPECIES: nitrogenase iron-molybdenum cofactor biosynthesis protein NifE [Thermoanaerobacterium]|uniref:Nitrogenase iron-molybdenum cofactor biosynthesis protein NifE n=1 Tax=Thermoanaerobacterium butyriciformans TaxID=1702242 RepID=A0ABS4NFG2_9THEO|nr:MULTISPECIES: nitrogenase iron-molybdenum cofactor biosynthesis protein NifE [Thermoanaerobacterium]MBP2072402.1 nitrogenase molybdenum-cofactor synthesis protein NifE [Thermoanaerobacterium butyriciformans]WKV09527.1 nitrogenase iron-molybdenum cofactor biosynthesis protein NifE [Thermoanaerobacterium sp. CMT5567-10]